MKTPQPKPDLDPIKPHAWIIPKEGRYYLVKVEWTVPGFAKSFASTSYEVDYDLGVRLVEAINAGVAFYNVTLKPLPGGKDWYVSYSSRILMRMANADLRKLGY
jgi:hypothetical protein